MTPTRIPSVSVAKSKSAVYWRNATECLIGMRGAAQSGRWHLTALNGVHCVIAAADALLVRTAGLRSKSKNHQDVFRLLKQHVRDSACPEMLKHGQAVLRQKSDIEYNARPIRPAEARQLVKHVERFYAWVETKLSV